MGSCAPSMEIDLDVWPLVEELMTLLEEIERIEAIASVKAPDTKASHCNGFEQKSKGS